MYNIGLIQFEHCVVSVPGEGNANVLGKKEVEAYFAEFVPLTVLRIRQHYRI